eukprot:jgi/Tetstr1/437153/TSEL_025913.t1
MVQRFQVGSAQSSVFVKKQPVALQVGDLTPKEIEAGIVGYCCVSKYQDRAWTNKKDIDARRQHLGGVREQSTVLEGQLFTARTEAAQADQRALLLTGQLASTLLRLREQQELARQVPVLQVVADGLVGDVQASRQALAESHARIDELEREWEAAETERQSIQDVAEAAVCAAQQDRDAAEKRADDHWRLLQNHAAMQKRDAGRDDVKQQRTLDGQVRSSMSVSALYKALNLERDSEGSLISSQYFETSFKSSLAELGWRKGHTKLKSFHFVVDAVLDSFESRSAKDSFLDAYVIFRQTKASPNAAMKMVVASKMPVVLDAVEMYNRPGRSKWEHLKTIRRTKLNARDFEEVLETICSPEHIQDLAFGSKELRLSSGKAIDIPAVQRKVCTS